MIKTLLLKIRSDVKFYIREHIHPAKLDIAQEAKHSNTLKPFALALMLEAYTTLLTIGMNDKEAQAFMSDAAENMHDIFETIPLGF